MRGLRRLRPFPTCARGFALLVFSRRFQAVAVGLAAVSLAAVLLAAVLLAAGLAVSARGAAASTSAVAASGARCAPVWFIGARGSGELASDYAGLGAPVDDMERVVASRLALKGLAVTSLAVEYPADSVDVLIPNKAVLALLAAGQTASAAALYVGTSVNPYDDSMDAGIVKAEAAVATVLGYCPDAKIIMAGYSQGATVVHDAEDWLAKHQPAQFRHVAGTLLLGDPDRVQYTKDKTFGTALTDAEGLRVRLHLVKPDEVPDPANTAEIANADDIVGDFAFSHIDTLARARHSASVHTSYAHLAKGTMSYEPVLGEAASWVAGRIGGLGVTDAHIRIGGTAYGSIPAGKVTTRQLTASGGSAPYTFHILSLDYGKAPAWVTLTTGGKLTLSPPVGLRASYSFRVYAVDRARRVSPLDAAAVTFTVTSAVKPPKWAAAVAPLPGDAAGPAGQNIDVNSVACPAAGSCVAVGQYVGSQVVEGLLLTEATGHWTAVTSPLPKDSQGFMSLKDVACASPTRCVAIGSYEASDANYYQGLILTWSGSSWTAAEAPAPPGGPAGLPDTLNSVSCLSSGQCVIGGQFDGEPLVITATGATLTAAAPPVPAGLPAGATAEFESVACASAAKCVAVGLAGQSGPGEEGIFDTGAGSAWKAVTIPLPGDAQVGPMVGLTSVACPSATRCVAVGTYTTAQNYAPFPLLLTGLGTSWTAASPPVPVGTSTYLVSNVSCQSATVCATTAVVGPGSGPSEEGLLLTETGTSWTAAKLPLPAGATSAQPYADWFTACQAGTGCVVAGSYSTTPGDVIGNDLGLLDTGAGPTLADQPLPAPSGDTNIGYAYGAACPPSGSCVVVGDYETGADGGGLLDSGPA